MVDFPAVVSGPASEAGLLEEPIGQEVPVEATARTEFEEPVELGRLERPAAGQVLGVHFAEAGPERVEQVVLAG